MAVGIFLFGTFLVILIFSLFVWLMIVIYREKDTLENNPIIINFMPQYSKGRMLGIQVSAKKGVGDREIIKYSPRDVNVRSNKKIENVEIIADRKAILTLPMGGGTSRERDFKIILPPNAENLSDDMKETYFGKVLMMATELKDVFNSELATVREGSHRKTTILERLGDGEISVDALKTIDGLMKDMIKMLAKEEISKSKHGSSHSGSGYSEVR